MKGARRSSRSLAGTEQLHPLAEDLDVVSTRVVLQRLHQEDLVAVRAVGTVLSRVARAADLVANALAQGGRVFYVGAGTSGRLGLLDAVECPPTFGTAPHQVQALMAGGLRAVIRAVEGAEDDAQAGRKDLRRHKVSAQDCVIGISASATTPYVLGALREAKRRKARTVLVSANAVKKTSAVDVWIRIPTGPELLAGSTRLKAGTATKLVLNGISTAAMTQLGKVYRGRMIDVQPTNAKLRERAARIVSELGSVSVEAATRLLATSGNSVRLSVIRAWTGVSLAQAKRLAANARSLRDLEGHSGANWRRATVRPGPKSR